MFKTWKDEGKKDKKIRVGGNFNNYCMALAELQHPSEEVGESSKLSTIPAL